MTNIKRGRPARNLQEAHEWAELCRLFQHINCLKAEEIEQKLGSENPTGQVWRSWCAGSRTPSLDRRRQVFRLLGWPELMNDPRPLERKLRKPTAEAVEKAIERSAAWQEFAISNGAFDTTGDRLGVTCHTLLTAVFDALMSNDDQIALDKIEAVCREIIDDCEVTKEWLHCTNVHCD